MKLPEPVCCRCPVLSLASVTCFLFLVQDFQGVEQMIGRQSLRRP